MVFLSENSSKINNTVNKIVGAHYELLWTATGSAVFGVCLQKNLGRDLYSFSLLPFREINKTNIVITVSIRYWRAVVFSNVQVKIRKHEQC